jgi:endonuclease YncB( thermonuclease family)
VPTYAEKLQALHKGGEKVPRYLPAPDHGVGLVHSVYDGDTLTLLCEIAGVPCSLSVRVHGIDTPEIRSKNTLETASAKAIRDLVTEEFQGQLVKTACQGADKYGRFLSSIELCDAHGASSATRASRPASLANFLVTNRLANTYDGGAKTDFCDEDYRRMIETVDRLRRRERQDG